MTLFDWFVPCLVVVLTLFLIRCARQSKPSAEGRRIVRTSILVGCLLEASIMLTILDDKGVRLPGPLAGLVFNPPMVALGLLIYQFVRVWDERFPEEGFAAVAARVFAGLAAFALVPWLVLGRLEPEPGHNLPPLTASLASALLGVAACVGLWLVMWLAARGASRT